MKLSVKPTLKKVFWILWKNKFKVLLILLLIFWVKSCFFKEDAKKAVISAQTPTILEVKKWDLEVAIEVTWKSKLVNERKLKFLQTGKVVEANFKNGDFVKKGDVISKLDTKDAITEIEKAKIALDNARAKHTKMISNNKDENLDYSNRVQDLEKKIEIAKWELEKLYLDNAQELKDKKLNLENDKSSLDTKKKNKSIDRQKIIDEVKKQKEDLAKMEADFNRYKASFDVELLKIKKEGEDKVNDYYRDLVTFKTTLSNEIQTFKDSLLTLNKITWYNKSDLKDSSGALYEVFSNQNNEYRLKSAGYSKSAQEEFDKIEKEAKKLDSKEKITMQDTIEYRKSLKKLYLELSRAYEFAYKGLNETTTTTYEWLVSSYKGTASSLRDSYLEKYNKLDSVVTALVTKDKPEKIKSDYDQKVSDKKQELKDKEKALNDKKDEVTKAINNLPNKLKEFDISYEKSMDSYDSSVSNLSELTKTHERRIEEKKNSIKTLEDDLKKSKKKFNETAWWPKNSDLILSKNDIKEAELRLKNANEKLKDYEIIAPFDGVIRKTEISFGDTIKTDTDKSIFIENPNLVQIDLELDQVDIVNATKWQEVIITFDAYKDKKFKGIITEIDTTPVDKNGSIAYKTSVELQKWDEKILTWMTAKAKILLSSKKDVLLIPNSAIEVDGDEKSYVNKWLWNAKKKTYIKTGLTNWVNTEVVSWIEEWTEIVEINFEANNFKSDDFYGNNNDYYGY